VNGCGVHGGNGRGIAHFGIVLLLGLRGGVGQGIGHRGGGKVGRSVHREVMGIREGVVHCLRAVRATQEVVNGEFNGRTHDTEDIVGDRAIKALSVGHGLGQRWRRII
jgi:hypothetical protein